MPERLGSKDVIRVLEDHGFTFITQRGSHAKYKNAAGRIAIVPHPKKELPIGTTRSIVRQSGLTPQDLGFQHRNRGNEDKNPPPLTPFALVK